MSARVRKAVLPVAGLGTRMLPVARAGGLAGEGGATLLQALFTATSALCVTGLTIVDTPAYWSAFGHLVILLLVQAGGLGIMTGATLLGLLVTRQMPLRGRLLASAEMRSLDLGDVQHVLRLVVIATLATEAVLTLGLRFWSWGMPFPEAMWHGLFHACSAFMNAGFSTLPEGLAPHRGDLLFLSPLMIGVILGGIGFPVLHELRLEWRQPQRWSIHTKLTLWGSLALTIAGSHTTQPITVTDTLGAGLTLATGPDNPVCAAAGQVITCTMPAGTAPGTYTVNYTATVANSATGTVANTVTATNPPGGDPDPVCTSCTTQHPVNSISSPFCSAMLAASARA